MTKIHSTAIVDPGASLGEGVEIGPYAIIGPSVRLADGCLVRSHAVITGWTELGKQCQVYEGAVVGGPPQDLKYKGEKSYLRVGDRTVIREGVTLHLATGEEEETRIGSDCLFMAYSHIGHNCVVGDHVILANCASVGGHAQLSDWTILGGVTGVHQFVRIGTGAYVGGVCPVRQDVVPYALGAGNPFRPSGVNVIGMRRRGFPKESISLVKDIFRLLFRSGLMLSEVKSRLETDFPDETVVVQFREFLRTSERNIARPRRSLGEDDS